MANENTLNYQSFVPCNALNTEHFEIHLELSRSRNTGQVWYFTTLFFFQIAGSTPFMETLLWWKQFSTKGKSWTCTNPYIILPTYVTLFSSGKPVSFKISIFLFQTFLSDRYGSWLQGTLTWDWRFFTEIFWGLILPIDNASLRLSKI